MRSRTAQNPAALCPRCRLRGEVCLCAVVPRVETATRFLVLRHVREARTTHNTARLAALAMPNLEIVEVGGLGAPFDPAPLAEPGTWLLYPGGGPPPEGPGPRKLVVLDGTWRLARRMYLHLDALRGLPLLSLPAPASAPGRLRQPPRPDGLSTLEAIAAAVRLLEGEGRARPLEGLLEEFFVRASAVRGRRHG